MVSGRTDQLALHHSLSVDLTVYHDLAKMSEPSQDFEDLVLGDLEVHTVGNLLQLTYRVTVPLSAGLSE